VFDSVSASTTLRADFRRLTQRRRLNEATIFKAISLCHVALLRVTIGRQRVPLPARGAHFEPLKCDARLVRDWRQQRLPRLR
jgi:hypothetical protein